MSERRRVPAHGPPALGLALLGAAALIALGAGAAQAQLVSKAKSASATAAYWTPERLRSAKPLPDPIAQGSPRDRAASKAPAGKRQSSPSGAGGGEGGNVTVAPSIQPKSEGASTNAAGSLGATFTNEREFPTATLRKNYPWRTVGKLFFTGAGGGNFLCSASVISRRVVA